MDLVRYLQLLLLILLCNIDFYMFEDWKVDDIGLLEDGL